MAILSFEVKGDILEEATVQALAERRSRSELCREALRQYLAAVRNGGAKRSVTTDQ